MTVNKPESKASPYVDFSYKVVGSNFSFVVFVDTLTSSFDQEIKDFYASPCFYTLKEALKEYGFLKDDKFIGSFVFLHNPNAGLKTTPVWYKHPESLLFLESFIESTNCTQALLFSHTINSLLSGKALKTATRSTILQEKTSSRGARCSFVYCKNSWQDEGFISAKFYSELKSSLNVLGSQNSVQKELVKDSFRREWVKDLQFIIDLSPETLALDTETTGLSHYKDSVYAFMAQLCFSPQQAYAVPLTNSFYKRVFGENPIAGYDKKIREQLQTLVTKTRKVVGHNLGFDLAILHKEGVIASPENIDDTQILAHYLDQDASKSLNACVKRYVPNLAGVNDSEESTLKKDDMENMPINSLLEYGCNDVLMTYQLYDSIYPLVKQDKRLETVLREIHRPAILTLSYELEKHGYPTSERLVLENCEKLEQDFINPLFEQLWRTAHSSVHRPSALECFYPADSGKSISNMDNWSKSRFLKEVFFGNAGLRLAPRGLTATGEASLNAKTDLVHYKSNPTVKAYLEWKKYASVSTSFLSKKPKKGLLQYVYNDAIRPSYNLCGTTTFRLASSSPNGQNFPQHGPSAKLVKGVFQTRDGYSFFKADFSQLELRLMAWATNCEAMIEAFNQGKDLHKVTGALVAKLSEEDFEKLPLEKIKEHRQAAKAVNFGLIYVMGEKSFIEYAYNNYGVVFSAEEVGKIYEAFFGKYPEIKRYHKRQDSFVKSNGYVRSILGHKRVLPFALQTEDKFLRMQASLKAVNAPIQGVGGLLGVLSCNRFREIRALNDISQDDMYLCSQIHDAVGGVCKTELLPYAYEFLTWAMTEIDFNDLFGIDNPPVPITIDIESGTNWNDLKEVKLCR